MFDRLTKVLRLALAAAVVVAGVSSLALAAGFFTNGVPPAGGTQYPSTIPLTGNETIPADTNLLSGQNPASEAITTNQLAAFGQSQPALNNLIIGGDATTNLFQRATTGASETTTYAYGGPDRWAYWSGTGTAMTVSQSTTAASLPAGYGDSFRMQRTAAQTGVVQMCMAQEITTANSLQLAGTPVELDFHAYTGANFSPAAPFNMTAYIVYGTGTDEGMQKLAYGLNAGGGGSVGWTGQANATAAVISLGGVSTLGRYAAVANIPATATEVGVALCYTPVGTAGTTDAIYFSGIQLVRNNALASYVNATVGYNALTTNTATNTTIQATAFQRRNSQFEAWLQYGYYYRVNEVDTAGAVQSPAGVYDTTTTCSVDFRLPAPMFRTPTADLGNLSATTFKINPTTTAVVLATPFALLQVGASTTTDGVMSFKTTSETANTMCVLQSTASGAGYFGFTSEL